MSEETEVATDPRLEQAHAEPEAAPEPDPAPEPEAPEAEVEPEGALEAEPEPQAEPEAAKKPGKSAETALKGRIGHLTKTLSGKDAELAQIRAEKQALEALLAQSGVAPSSEGTAPAQPAPRADGERVFTAADVQAEARRIAAKDAFDAQANATYEAGVKKHGDNFKEAVENLNAVGVMSDSFLEAAFATDAASEVINFLGADPEEAARVANLPPVRMAAELTKIAAKLTAPKTTKVSAAPAPFTPVSGAVSPSIDLAKAADGGDDMSAYAAARAKQGSPWAMTSRERSAAARAR